MKTGADEIGRQPAINHLLAALPLEVFRRLEPHLEPIKLRTRQVLLAREQPIGHVFFPETAVCSLITVMADGEAAESGTVGCDGFVGVDLVLGARSASCDTVVQVPGRALRMRAEAFLKQLAESPAINDVVRRHVHSLLVQSLQSTACNRLHSLVQRCCRWLLLTHDRAGRDEFRLTHDLLAVMVGVRRPSVSAVLRDLEREGVLARGRGVIAIRDRAALEGRACECYEAVNRNLRNVTPRFASGQTAQA